MDFVKKIINSKYILIITFFFMVLAFSTFLYVTIQQDLSSGQPSDGFNRAPAEIASFPEGTITIDSVEYYKSPIYVNVTISENEILQSVPLNGNPIKTSDIPNMKVGTKITVKYPDDNHEYIMYSKDYKINHRVFLYIFYSIIILASIAGFILFIRRNRIRDHREVMEENIRKMHEDKEKSEAGAFNSLDREVSPDDIFNPFTDSGIDYNAKYEQDRIMSDAAFNENDSYPAFGNDPFYSGESTFSEQNNNSVTSYAGFGTAVPSNQPAPSYAGFGAADPNNQPIPSYAGFGAAVPNNQSAPYNGNAPENTPVSTANSGSQYTNYSNENTQVYSGYGAPNPSMDMPIDPTAPYTGYGAPNPSMDSQYDPFTPYTGY